MFARCVSCMTIREIDMKPLAFIFLSCALHAGAAEPAKPVPHKAAWFSGLQGLKESMSGIRGLGENMANRPGADDIAQLKNFDKSLQYLELIKPAAEIRLGER